MMDIQRYAVMNVAKDYNSATDISYNRQSGMRGSVNEHLIPELVFTSAAHPGVGISAIKALAIASAQGQKIFTITAQNVDTILPQLSVSPEIQTEIQNAVATGKVATISQGNITIAGWTGSGYTIIDPSTGAGAYKISGGFNGGLLQSFLDNFGAALGLYGLLLGGIAALFPLAAFAGTFFFLSFLITLVLAIDSLILYLMTADPAKCGNGRVALFSVPTFIALFGVQEFIPYKVGVVLFSAAFVTDGAVNNTCFN
jgi:hypothetical protein